jgi:sugar lactone lactonase YvrE
MNRIIRNILFMIVFGVSVFGGAPAVAKDAQLHPSLSPQIDLGEPGLSFAYAQTYGYTREPYSPDMIHLNRPAGLFIDGADKLYVTEDGGQRLLRYAIGGSDNMAIGRAGVCDRGDYSFCGIRDAVADAAGNFWVADGSRVVKYDPNGNYQLTLEPEAPDYALIVSGVALDSNDHLFVSDAGRERILVYDISGLAPVYHSTIGVTDTSGSAPGYLNGPKRIAVDSQNRVIVVEGNAYQLGPDDWRAQRCAYTSGWTCEVVATGLYSPQGVTVDDSNVIYIADTYNSRIRRCTAPNVCTDFVTGTYRLSDLAFDSGGSLYASAGEEHVVVMYDPAGVEVGYAYGEYMVPYVTDGYHYNVPRVTLDGEDNIIIVEETGQRLVKLDPEGNFLWEYGVPGVAFPDNDHLNYPYGAATDADGNIYVADGGCRVQIIDPDGNYLDTFGGDCGNGDYEFTWITGIAVGADGWLYVSDADNHRVQIYDETLSYVDTIGETGVCGTGDDQLCKPWGVEVDAAGNIYVADGDNRRVQVFDSTLTLQLSIGVAGEPGNDFDHFAYPNDVAVDVDGNIFVSDCDNHRVQVFDPTGAYLTTIGGRFGENTSQFAYPSSVALDSEGNLFVAERDNHRIQRFTRGVPGWEQINLNGFGDPFNTGLYAQEIFNGQLYATSGSWVNGAQVWRLELDGSWTAVSEPGFGVADPLTNPAIPDMIVFDGQLYAGTAWAGVAGQVWRTPDGTTWEQVVVDGFGNPSNAGVTTFDVFDGKLYACTFNLDEGLQIWLTSTGDLDDWENVVTGGNGNLNNYIVTSLIEFDGDLYVAIENMNEGAQIWKSSDGDTWAAVATGGFGDVDNTQLGGMTIFGGYLYVGTRNDVTGAQLFRTNDGSTWDPILEDGFGDVNNFKIEMVLAVGDRLFAGTDNHLTGAEIWQSDDGLTWRQINPDGWGDGNNAEILWNSSSIEYDRHLCIGTTNQANGGEIWCYTPTTIFLPLISK